MKRARAAIAAPIIALLLVACGGEESVPSGGSAAPSPSAADVAPSSSAHNASDVRFAREMIVHHRQAVEMSELAVDRASAAEVKDLARRIQTAQQPEIEVMTGWLQEWGEPLPGDDGAEGGHGGHSAGSGSGMMTAEEMTQLAASSGTEFDREFLTLMTRHHLGAVEMARQEMAEGRSEPARELAAKIEQDQQAEIAEMGQLIDRLEP